MRLESALRSFNYVWYAGSFSATNRIFHLVTFPDWAGIWLCQPGLGNLQERRGCVAHLGCACIVDHLERVITISGRVTAMGTFDWVHTLAAVAFGPGLFWYSSDNAGDADRLKVASADSWIGGFRESAVRLITVRLSRTQFAPVNVAPKGKSTHVSRAPAKLPKLREF